VLIIKGLTLIGVDFFVGFDSKYGFLFLFF